MPVVDDGTKSRLFTIVDIDNIEATAFEVRSPLFYAVQTAAGFSEKEVDVPEGSAGGNFIMMARQTGAVESLKLCAARKGFGSLELSYLRQLAAHLGAADEVTLVDMIASLIKHILPESPAETVLQALENRLVSYEEQPDIYEDALNDDTIYEAFDPKDHFGEHMGSVWSLGPGTVAIVSTWCFSSGPRGPQSIVSRWGPLDWTVNLAATCNLLVGFLVSGSIAHNQLWCLEVGLCTGDLVVPTVAQLYVF